MNCWFRSRLEQSIKSVARRNTHVESNQGRDLRETVPTGPLRLWWGYVRLAVAQCTESITKFDATVLANLFYRLFDQKTAMQPLLLSPNAPVDKTSSMRIIKCRGKAGADSDFSVWSRAVAVASAGKVVEVRKGLPRGLGSPIGGLNSSARLGSEGAGELSRLHGNFCNAGRDLSLYAIR